jgi:hypothetical protein
MRMLKWGLAPARKLRLGRGTNIYNYNLRPDSKRQRYDDSVSIPNSSKKVIACKIFQPSCQSLEFTSVSLANLGIGNWNAYMTPWKVTRVNCVMIKALT